MYICSEQDAANIYETAMALNMTSEGYAWIVTEQSITGNALKEAPLGLLGIKLNGSKNTSAHIVDALKVVATGLHSYAQIDGALEDNGPPKHCRDDPWTTGGQFYK